MAAAAPWGINAEEEESSSFACEGCAVTGGSLFVTVTRTATGTDTSETDAILDAMEAYGPIELDIYVKYSWTAPPSNGQARLGYFTNTCVPYTYITPPPGNVVLNRSVSAALVCQWFTSPGAWQANLAISRYTDTACTTGGAQVTETRVAFSCSPILWEYQITDIFGNVFKIEVTE
jgi:hypothetical protein